MEPILLTDREEYQFVTDRGITSGLQWIFGCVSKSNGNCSGIAFLVVGISHRQTNGVSGGFGSISRTDARNV